MTESEPPKKAVGYRTWMARIFVALALAFALSARLLGRLDDPPPPFDDPAIRNLVVMISLFLVGMVVWSWFCFRSNFSRKVRFGVLTGTVLLFLTLAGSIVVLGRAKVLHFSGSLIPHLATKEHDPAMLVSNTSAGDADLSATTPHDFPQFLGPDRSGWIDASLEREWQQHPPRKIWERPIGAGWSAFAASNGFAFTLEQRGNEEWVTCYEVETGKPVWGHAVEGRHETALGGIGPRSTPTIHNGHVYALGATGVLRCLNERGELVWSDDLRRRYRITASEDEEHVMFGRAASPLIVDSLVIVPGGGPQGRAKNLIAFDARSGELVWEAENKLSDDTTDQIAYASPSLVALAGRQQILIVNESTVSGHDPKTGRTLWSHPWPGRSDGNASTSQAVAIADNRVLLTKGYGGGAEVIELRAAGENLSTSTIWKSPRSLQTKFCNVVVHDGHAFALSEGILECVALEDGRRRWKKGRYGHGQILGVGELLLVLNEDGELHLLELNPKQSVHLGSIQALEGKTWNNLCLYGNRLLLRNAQEAACYELH